MHLTEAGEEERRHFLTGVGKLYNGFKDKARPVNSFGFKRRYKLLSKLKGAVMFSPPLADLWLPSQHLVSLFLDIISE